MNRHIGFFTAYQPHVELAQEGIGRLMVYIIKGMIANGDRVTVLAPSWHRGGVKKLLKEFSLDRDVKVKTVRWHPPVMLILYEIMYWLSRRQRKDDDDEDKESFDFGKLLKYIVFSQLASYSFILFFIYLILFIALFIALLPVFILYVVLALGFKILKILSQMKGFTFLSDRIGKYLSFVPRRLRSDSLVLGLLDAAREDEVTRMIRFVNKGNIDLWYVPNIFWKEVLKIKKKRVIVAPDVVYAEFPQLFYIDSVIQATSRTLDHILKTKPKVVCYSNHVKNRHLVQLRDFKPGSVTVIPHGAVDISEHLRMGLPPKEIIEIYLRKAIYDIPDPFASNAANMNFAEGKFILYSSQSRFHKNIVMLLRVLDRLLRREHINLKLVLTCDNLQYLKPHLEQLNLMREVVFMPRVPESVLAALNNLALLHVNPTLFEGGFPFTFSEAYSVGTPSVMSDIPVTREYVDDELAKVMLFDPYDLDDFVAKVKWGLEHRDELLALEKPLFDKFASRTWDIVAEEYVNAMSYSYRRKLPKRKRKPWKKRS